MLDDRKLEVLRAIVEDFVSTTEPVGSKALAERHCLGVSPATVRKELTGPAAWWVGTAAGTYGRLAHAYRHGFTDDELEELSRGPWRGRPADPENS